MVETPIKKDLVDVEQQKQVVDEQKEKLESELTQTKRIVQKLKARSEKKAGEIEREFFGAADRLLIQAGELARQLNEPAQEAQLESLKARLEFFNRDFTALMARIKEVNKEWEYLAPAVLVSKVETFNLSTGELVIHTSEDKVESFNLSVPDFGGKPKDCVITNNGVGRATVLVFYPNDQEVTIQIAKKDIRISVGARSSAESVAAGTVKSLAEAVAIFDNLHASVPTIKKTPKIVPKAPETIPLPPPAPEVRRPALDTRGYSIGQEVYYKNDTGALEPTWKITGFVMEDGKTMVSLFHKKYDAGGKFVNEESAEITVKELHDIQKILVPTVPASFPAPDGKVRIWNKNTTMVSNNEETRQLVKKIKAAKRLEKDNKRQAVEKQMLAEWQEQKNKAQAEREEKYGPELSVWFNDSVKQINKIDNTDDLLIAIGELTGKISTGVSVEAQSSAIQELYAMALDHVRVLVRQKKTDGEEAERVIDILEKVDVQKLMEKIAISNEEVPVVEKRTITDKIFPPFVRPENLPTKDMNVQGVEQKPDGDKRNGELFTDEQNAYFDRIVSELGKQDAGVMHDIEAKIGESEVVGEIVEKNSLSKFVESLADYFLGDSEFKKWSKEKRNEQLSKAFESRTSEFCVELEKSLGKNIFDIFKNDERTSNIFVSLLQAEVSKKIREEIISKLNDLVVKIAESLVRTAADGMVSKKAEFSVNYYAIKSSFNRPFVRAQLSNVIGFDFDEVEDCLSSEEKARFATMITEECVKMRTAHSDLMESSLKSSPYNSNAENTKTNDINNVKVNHEKSTELNYALDFASDVFLSTPSNRSFLEKKPYCDVKNEDKFISLLSKDIGVYGWIWRSLDETKEPVNEDIQSEIVFPEYGTEESGNLIKKIAHDYFELKKSRKSDVEAFKKAEKERIVLAKNKVKEFRNLLSGKKPNSHFGLVEIATNFLRSIPEVESRLKVELSVLKELESYIRKSMEKSSETDGFVKEVLTAIHAGLETEESRTKEVGIEVAPAGEPDVASSAEALSKLEDYVSPDTAPQLTAFGEWLNSSDSHTPELIVEAVGKVLGELESAPEGDYKKAKEIILRTVEVYLASDVPDADILKVKAEIETQLFLEEEARKFAIIMYDSRDSEIQWDMGAVEGIIFEDQEEKINELFPGGVGDFATKVFERAKELTDLRVKAEDTEPEEKAEVLLATEEGVVDIPREALVKMMDKKRVFAVMNLVINVSDDKSMEIARAAAGDIFSNVDLAKLKRELAPFGYTVKKFLERWRETFCEEYLQTLVTIVNAERTCLVNVEVDAMRTIRYGDRLDKTRIMAAQAVPALTSIAVTTGTATLAAGTGGAFLPLIVGLATAGGMTQAVKYIDAIRGSVAKTTESAEKRMADRRAKAESSVAYSQKINDQLRNRLAAPDMEVRLMSYLSESLRQGSANKLGVTEDLGMHLYMKSVKQMIDTEMQQKLLEDKSTDAEVAELLRQQQDARAKTLVEGLFVTDDLVDIVTNALEKDPKLLRIFEGASNVLSSARVLDLQGIGESIQTAAGNKKELTVAEKKTKIDAMSNKKKVGLILLGILGGGTVGVAIATHEVSRAAVGAMAGGYMAGRYGTKLGERERQDAFIAEMSTVVDEAEQALRSSEIGILLVKPILFEDLKKKVMDLRVPLSLGLFDNTPALKIRAKDTMRRIDALTIQRHVESERTLQTSVESQTKDTLEEYKVLEEKIRNLKVDKRLEGAKKLMLDECTKFTALFIRAENAADRVGLKVGQFPESPIVGLTQNIDKLMQLNKIAGLVDSLKDRGVIFDSSAIRMIWYEAENMKSLSKLDSALQNAKDKITDVVSNHYLELVSKERYKKSFKKLNPNEQTLVKDGASKRTQEILAPLWTRVSPETTVTSEVMLNSKVDLFLRELESEVGELKEKEKEVMDEMKKKPGKAKTIRLAIEGALLGAVAGYFSTDVRNTVSMAKGEINLSGDRLLKTGEVALSYRGPIAPRSSMVYKPDSEYLATPTKAGIAAKVSVEGVRAQSAQELPRTSATMVAGAPEAAPPVSATPKFDYDQYAAEHKLNPAETQYLKGFATKWGNGNELNNPETMDRILKASELQAGKASIFGKEVFSGAVDTPLEAAREADMVKFEEILRHGGPDQAGDYLASRNLKGLALEKIGNPNGDPNFYRKFATEYNDKVLEQGNGSKDISMMRKLGGALQQDENTDMYGYKEGGLFGRLKRLIFQNADSKAPMRVLGMDENDPNKLINGNTREAVATIRQPRVDASPSPSKESSPSPVTAATKLQADFAASQAGTKDIGSIVVEGNFQNGTALGQVEHGGAIPISPLDIYAKPDGTVDVLIGDKIVNANVAVNPANGGYHLYPVGGRGPDFTASGQASLKSAMDRIAFVDSRSSTSGGGGGGGGSATGAERALSPAAAKVFGQGTIDRIREGISYNQGRPATDQDVLKSQWGKVVTKIDPEFGAAPRGGIKAPEPVPTITGEESLTAPEGVLDKWRQSAGEAFARENGITPNSRSSKFLDSAINKIDNAIRWHGDPSLAEQVRTGVKLDEVAKIVPDGLTSNEKLVLGMGKEAQVLMADGRPVIAQVAENGSHLARVKMPDGGFKEVYDSNLRYAQDENGNLRIKGLDGRDLGRGQVGIRLDGTAFIKPIPTATR